MKQPTALSLHAKTLKAQSRTDPTPYSSPPAKRRARQQGTPSAYVRSPPQVPGREGGEGDRLSDMSASEPTSEMCARSRLPKAEPGRDGCLEGAGGLTLALLLRRYWVDQIESSFSISRWTLALSCSRRSACQVSKSRSIYGVILQ
jgi:hypothetical protein